MLKATNYKGLQAAINTPAKHACEQANKILQRSTHASKHDSIPIQLIYNKVSLHLKPLRISSKNLYLRGELKLVETDLTINYPSC